MRMTLRSRSQFIARFRAHHRFALARCSMLLFASLYAAAALACTPTPLPLGAQGEDLCYGAAEWNEPTLNGRRLQQAFDFYRVPTSAPAPLNAPLNRLLAWLPPTLKVTGAPAVSANF